MVTAQNPIIKISIVDNLDQISQCNSSNNIGSEGVPKMINTDIISEKRLKPQNIPTRPSFTPEPLNIDVPERKLTKNESPEIKTPYMNIANDKQVQLLLKAMNSYIKAGHENK